MPTGKVIALEEHPFLRFQGTARANKGQNDRLLVDAHDVQGHRVGFRCRRRPYLTVALHPIFSVGLGNLRLAAIAIQGFAVEPGDVIAVYDLVFNCCDQRARRTIYKRRHRHKIDHDDADGLEAQLKTPQVKARTLEYMGSLAIRLQINRTSSLPRSFAEM